MSHSIRTLKIEKYRGAKIYVRNFNNIFEYLVLLNEELYTTHMVVTKPFWQTITGKDYTEKQLTDTVKYLMNVAQATVDHVLDSGT